MSTIKSVASLASVLKKPKISRKHLSRYSWLPDVLRVEGSIAVHIIGPVLTVTIFASAVAFAWHKGHNVTLSNSVTPLLAVVVGLILVFRNSTSYDRYYEGRKDWGQLTSQIRNLSRLVWVNVALPPDAAAATVGKGAPSKPMLTAAQLTHAKADMLRLAVAYAFAVKRLLRGEQGPDAEIARILPRGLRGLSEDGGPGVLTSSGRSTTVSRRTSYQATGTQGTVRRKRENSSDDDVEANAGFGSVATSTFGLNRDSITIPDANASTPLLGNVEQNVQFHAYANTLKLPLPLVIAHELTQCIFKFRRDGYLETIGPAGMNSMNTLVQGMVDQLTNMERIATTPIPISYAIHLKQCVTLYLFALPFTLVKDLHWYMIPIVTVVAFTLMGIEGIANEIEMPFGQDTTDLPLDKFCDDLKEEIDFMIERLPEGGQGAFGYDDGEGDD